VPSEALTAGETIGPPTLKLRRASFVLATLGEGWWSRSGSNRRPRRCERRALSTELLPRTPNRLFEGRPGGCKKQNGRAGEIRTHDLLHPMQARYQTTLQPDDHRKVEEARCPGPRQALFNPISTRVNHKGPKTQSTWSGHVLFHALCLRAFVVGTALVGGQALAKPCFAQASAVALRAMADRSRGIFFSNFG
jgi:hypothetical protein